MPVNKSLEKSEPNLIASFLESLDVNEATRAGYVRAFRQFARWAEREGRAPSEMRRADICAYRDRLSEEHSPGTVRAYLVPVKAFYRWTAAEGVHPNVAEGVKPPKQRRGFAKDALTPEQLARILVGMEGREDANALRDRSIITLMAYTGLRSVEVARADVGDLRTAGDRRVLWIQGKGRSEKDSFVVVPDTAARILDSYLSARGATEREPLFTSSGNRNKGGRMTTRSISRVCKEAFRAAGIDSERITAHSLRHTAVTAALLGGASVQEAQAMARHSSINTTMIYSHNLDRLESPAEMRAAEYYEGREEG